MKFYLGDWDYSEVLPKSALGPNGGRNGGRWTGIEVMTWDPKESVYRDHSLWYDSPDHVNYVGHFEGESLVFRSEFDYDGKHVKFHMEARPRAGGGVTLDEFASVDGGPEQATLHGTAIPRPR